MTRHQYEISVVVSRAQTSFRGETSGGVRKCRLFSQAMITFSSWLPKRKRKQYLCKTWGVNKVYYMKYELGDCDLTIRKTILMLLYAVCCCCCLLFVNRLLSKSTPHRDTQEIQDMFHDSLFHLRAWFHQLLGPSGSTFGNMFRTFTTVFQRSRMDHFVLSRRSFTYWNQANQGYIEAKERHYRRAEGKSRYSPYLQSTRRWAYRKLYQV